MDAQLRTELPSDQGLLDTLDGFVGGRLRVGDTTILIATLNHLDALEERVRAPD